MDTSDFPPRSRFTLSLPYWAAPLVLLVIVELLGLISDQWQISGDTIDDADTLMRLSYLRAIRDLGHWNDGFFDRNNAPYGMVLHWTLPFNWLVLTLARAFSFLGDELSLHYAGYWTGPLLRFAVAVAAYWAARQALSHRASALAGGLILFSPFMVNYASRGSANHHPLLYLDIVIMAGMAIALTRGPSRHWLAILAGILAGFCLWCSFELVIVAGALFGWLFLLWIRDGAPRNRQLLLAGLAFSIMVDAALLADPPYGGMLAVAFDHVSLPLQFLACLPALAALYAIARGETGRLWHAGSAAIALCGLYVVFYPGILHGVEGAMDPFLRDDWLPQIGEVQPITNPVRLAVYLAPCMLFLLLAPVILHGWRRQAIAALCLLMMLVMGLLHYRMVEYPVIAASLVAGYYLDLSTAHRFRAVRLGMPVLVGLLLAGYYGLEVAESLFDIDIYSTGDHPPIVDNGSRGQAGIDDPHADDPVNDDVDDDDDDDDCSAYNVKDALNDSDWLGQGGEAPIVLNDINFAPALLYWTDLRTVGGNYHRDNAGIVDNYKFFRATDLGEAHAIATQRGVDFVLVCGDGRKAEYAYTSLARLKAAMQSKDRPLVPDRTLYVQLIEGHPPAWLKRRDWPDDVHTGLWLYEVVNKSPSPPTGGEGCPANAVSFASSVDLSPCRRGGVVTGDRSPLRRSSRLRRASGECAARRPWRRYRRHRRSVR